MIRPDHAERLQAVLGALKERLGVGYFSRPGGETGFEITDKGRAVIHKNGLAFFLSEGEGELVASRVRGGRAEFAHVGEDGSMTWTMVPLAAAELN